MPLAGKVNESLNKTFAYKGDDGLSQAERLAYDACKSLSCKHEACYKRFMYHHKKQQSECSPLMKEWRQCFKQKLELFSQEARS
jgi:hypothetical protein